MRHLRTQSVGLPEIENLFFSRRNFSQPERQLGPHKNFSDEVKVLDQHCDGTSTRPARALQWRRH
jgi:hypothetical protein